MSTEFVQINFELMGSKQYRVRCAVKTGVVSVYDATEGRGKYAILLAEVTPHSVRILERTPEEGRLSPQTCADILETAQFLIRMWATRENTPPKKVESDDAGSVEKVVGEAGKDSVLRSPKVDP